ncbi:MAG: carbohydrate ABC transporter permease [Acidobacteriota bacterium]|nr:carbohydrate ABC transporter permease [Acidobacteriota bacterium]
MSATITPQARQRRRTRVVHVLAHTVLLLGCLLFGFPFYWLLSTSVKEQDEMFREPPVWVPAWPRAVEKSPYFAQDEYAFPEAPAGVSAEAWQSHWPKIAAVAVSVMRSVYLDPRQIRADETPQMREAVARGLYQTISKRLDGDQLKQLASEPEPLMARTVTERDCKTVWENVRRALVIRGVTVQDQGFVQYKLGEDDPVSQWRDSGGKTDLQPTQLGKRPAAEVAYDFGGSSTFVLEARLKSAMAPESFRRLTIPFRGDKSWHRVDLEADIGGTLYRSTEPLVLFTDLAQEVAWQLPDAERTGAGAFRDYLPLAKAGAGTCGPDEVGVKLTVRKSGFWQAGYAKARRNYRDALNYVPMGTYFRNTLLLVLLNVAGQLFSCSVVAYAFARLRWPGRDVSFAVLLSTMMLPAQVTMIPVFLIYRYLGWYDTLQPLWVGSFFGSAFFIFLLRQFMRTVPRDLEEAARIDGCSFWGLYWRIILPLMKPALAAVAIFSFMNAWNEFMGPLIYLNDQRLYPLSLGLYQFRIEHASDFGMLMAASALMILPVVVVFFLAQKHFIQGVTLTGMKG